jgi:gluconolactonase
MGGVLFRPQSNGAQVFAPDGTKIGMIHLPEPCSNPCFGGLKRNRLFMTDGESLHSLYVEAQGLS